MVFFGFIMNGAVKVRIIAIPYQDITSSVLMDIILVEIYLKIPEYRFVIFEENKNLEEKAIFFSFIDSFIIF